MSFARRIEIKFIDILVNRRLMEMGYRTDFHLFCIGKIFTISAKNDTKFAIKIFSEQITDKIKVSKNTEKI